MRRALLIAAASLTACAFPEDPEERYERWTEEAAEHGAFGVSGSFRLEGAPTVDVTAPAGDLDAPFALEGSFTIDDAVVAGRGVGTLIVSQSPLTAVASGRAHGVPAARATVAAAGVRIQTDATAGIEVTDLVFDGAVPFELQLADGSFAQGTEALAVTSGSLRTSGIVVPSVSAAIERLAAGGDAVGTATLGEREIDDAIAVFGHEAEVTLSAGAAAGDARVTQVLTSEEVAIPAVVEIATMHEDAHVFPPGASRAVTFAFRELSYEGDAVLSAFRVEGEAAEQVVIAASPPADHVAQLIDVIEQSGPAAPIVVIALAPVLPIVAIGDAIGDFFGGGSSSPTPVPLPSWIDAGAVGTFSVVVNAGTMIGPRSATLILEGANFATVEVELEWEVEEDD